MDFQAVNFYSFIAPTLILLVGVIDDLRTKKIHNKLVLALLVFAAIYQFVFNGSQGLLAGLMGSGMALLIFLPMTLGKALGAGDMKLMLAFGMSTTWPNVLWTSIYSLIWAAVFGVIFALSHKKLKHLLFNTMQMATFKKSAQQETLKIPFTIALIMGWLHHAYLTLMTSGGL